MVFDLLQYIPLLGEEARKQVSEHIKAKVIEVADPIRRARARLGSLKLNKVLGFLKHSEKTIAQLHQEYLAALELDGKPEKGERKLADDLIILIDELMEARPLSDQQAVIYRIGLMEFALERSPYNFDIQMRLLKVYDALHLSPSFN